MRKEDHQKKAGHCRLDGFKKIYEEAARRYLDSLQPEQVNNEAGYWSLDIDQQILDLIPPGWEDVKQRLRTYPLDTVMADYVPKVLQPLRFQTQEAVKVWWKTTWKQRFVDFRGIPPAPRNGDVTPKRISLRQYQAGQLRLIFAGEKGNRQCTIFAGNVALYRFDVASLLDLREMPTYIATALLPELKRIADLCDWSQLSQLSFAQQQALKMRLNVIQHYYHQKHPDIHEKINQRAREHLTPIETAQDARDEC